MNGWKFPGGKIAKSLFALSLRFQVPPSNFAFVALVRLNLAGLFRAGENGGMTPSGRRFIAEWVVVGYYIGPLVICWGLALLASGALWWSLVVAGVLWPLGNLIVGIILSDG